MNVRISICSCLVASMALVAIAARWTCNAGMAAEAAKQEERLPAGGASAADDLELAEQKAFRAAIDKAAPAVVRIETIGGLERVHGMLFGTGPTTGVVVDPQGYIVSSAFNFLNKPTSILVRMPDGTRKQAELVCTDHNRMLVLLKINPDKPLTAAEPVPSGEMRVGQWTLAIGRTFEGERPNLAVGILSAVDRVWGKALQTDASISPNNYGGPLVDLRGRVFGVLVPLSSQSVEELAGVEWYDSGIGFAVPLDFIQTLLPRMKANKDLYPGLIGISLDDDWMTGDPIIAAARANTPAADAGLKAGDRIVQIDGRPIRRGADIKREISPRYAGDKLRIVVMRGTDLLERKVELAAKLEPYVYPMLGILPMRDPGKQGTVVRYVYPNGPAAEAKMRPGDVVVSLAGKAVADANALRERLTTVKPGDVVEVEYKRADKTEKVKVKLGTLPEDLPPADLPPARAAVKFEGERPQVGTVALQIPEFKNESFLYVPEAYSPLVPHGVVVWLHAPGGFQDRELLARWKDLCDKYDLILLAPKAADPARWDPEETTFVQRLVEKVKSTYNVDPQRLVVHGYENGGAMAYLVALRNQQLIRAVAAVEALPVGVPVENDPLHRLAIYTTTASKSPRAAAVEEVVKIYRDQKIPVTVKNLGADPRYLNSQELAELVRWFDMLDRL
jgi:serine protease Do